MTDDGTYTGTRLSWTGFPQLVLLRAAPRYTKDSVSNPSKVRIGKPSDAALRHAGGTIPPMLCTRRSDPDGGGESVSHIGQVPPGCFVYKRIPLSIQIAAKRTKRETAEYIVQTPRRSS
jgi:hypothetical protein